MENFRSCFSSCEFFKCGQRALISSRNRMYCRWADDDCVGPTCNYALCIRGRLLSNQVCGLTVKRKTNDKVGPETLEDNGKIYNVKLRGKILRRFKEDDLI